MSLPKIQHPIYSTILPSTGKKINFRGFLSKEEKLLLLANQSQEPEQLVMALKQILTNCIIDKIDVDKMIMPDVEFVYLQIITKSIGEELDLVITCGECKEEINYRLALNNIAAPKLIKKANVIKISDNLFLTLKYPTIDTLDDLDIINETNETQTTENIFAAIVRNVECITFGEETFHLVDQSIDEILAWFDDLSGKQLKLITDFFKNIPTIEELIEFDCKCGHHNTFRIRGISELFM
ncbi:MAG: hypothetical protein PHG08_00235 [Bacilli bacterium]|nr:hypothetical protein [Bacilli bacterium]